MNQKKTYIYHQDPGHGWLAVKRSELVKLNIADKITPYSYSKGQTVYLEEDLDFTTFAEAYEREFGSKPAYRSSYSENTPIRRYQSYFVEGA